ALFQTVRGAKGGHLLNATRRSKGQGDGRDNPDSNSRQSSGASNRALSESQAQPKYRFWSLYGELLRQDVLAAALEVQTRNGGAAGVDDETIESINQTPEKRQQ